MIRGRVKASARKIVSGYCRRTSAIIHSQKWKAFVCGLSTRKMRTPRAHQNSTTPFSATQRLRHSAHSKSMG